ncbi:unnamed protein product, partial [Meganyctiphanes norvegica]
MAEIILAEEGMPINASTSLTHNSSIYITIPTENKLLPTASSIYNELITPAIQSTVYSNIVNPFSALDNATTLSNNGTLSEDDPSQSTEDSDSSMVIVMTIIYVIISITSIVGNVATCTVIAQNRIMHTATNYYLFSMAVSDLLLLITGMPHEMHTLWHPSPYMFGAAFCITRGLAAETSTNASILTISAFTVERYIGICHPLKSHTMSQLGRVIRFIIAIWFIALFCAIPQAVQYGVVYDDRFINNTVEYMNSAQCNIRPEKKLNYAFEISTFLFFCAPMTLILVLYINIGLELKRSAHLARAASSVGNHYSSSSADRSRNKAVIKMLVAVVLAFFICWAPFHAQRLLAIYGDASHALTVTIYGMLNHISGIFFYTSTCINPILYHTMSNRFRQALKVTLESCCGRKSSGSSGGRWLSHGKSTRSHPAMHNLELTEQTFASETTTTTTNSHDRRGSDPKTTIQFLIQDQKGSLILADNSTAQSLSIKNHLPGKILGRKSKNYLKPTNFKFKPRFQKNIIENPMNVCNDKLNGSDDSKSEDALRIAQQQPNTRKPSTSNSINSGTTISNSSLSHMEAEFTREELVEAMARANNVEERPMNSQATGADKFRTIL